LKWGDIHVRVRRNATAMIQKDKVVVHIDDMHRPLPPILTVTFCHPGVAKQAMENFFWFGSKFVEMSARKRKTSQIKCLSISQLQDHACCVVCATKGKPLTNSSVPCFRIYHTKLNFCIRFPSQHGKENISSDVNNVHFIVTIFYFRNI